MKNFIEEGKNLSVKAPYNVDSGGIVVIEDIHGVAIVSARKNHEITICTWGVYELAKDPIEDILQGQKAYFRLDEKLVTGASSHQDGEGPEAGHVEHYELGVFIADAPPSTTVARVKIR